MAIHWRGKGEGGRTKIWRLRWVDRGNTRCTHKQGPKNQQQKRTKRRSIVGVGKQLGRERGAGVTLSFDPQMKCHTHAHNASATQPGEGREGPPRLSPQPWVRQVMTKLWGKQSIGYWIRDKKRGVPGEAGRKKIWLGGARSTRHTDEKIPKKQKEQRRRKPKKKSGGPHAPRGDSETVSPLTVRDSPTPLSFSLSRACSCSLFPVSIVVPPPPG